MRQLCAAIINYGYDHKGAPPPRDSWPEVLQKGNYIGDNSLLQCPAQPRAGRAYAMNAKLCGSDLSEVRQPSATVLLFECASGSPPTGGPELLPVPPRHGWRKSAGYNIGFCDGHIEHIEAQELGRLVWDPKAEPPKK